ncbi:hypothetical protein PPTG_22233 [Phytophthora nicotianae INRA-310]|uniref:PiggyBac transposable element-derived protein domain-containing protein n=1 Tax=Phytophthora nicotianae (strain INRA-310) TaxID=761204 RepID=W2QN31_PHYN3|nr:hypothetical protein PPTG_22233 [Phytophthora nicotianae INRA-310]ETN14351.1 hypothetical protein PPTG_22233 [Phytophthora nicotianae INRA-310]
MNAPNEKPFKQLWRELSKAGWKSRKPKGLSVDYTYVMPGVTGRLNIEKRGVEYFVGEQELMKFGRRRGLLELQPLPSLSTRAPMGKDAAYALACRRVPVERVLPAEEQATPTLEATPTPPTPPLSSPTHGLENHWSTREDGAVPRGTFSRYMKRDRFKMITRYLHFASNNAEAASKDKAWKVRPVLQVLEKTFCRGYRLGPQISFDEGTIPNRSKFNPVRVYNKDKPHKYGTKVYMTCCAETGYCSRIEVYLGAANNPSAAKGTAQKAVIRNVTKALDGQPAKRLVVADNFYSSCALVLDLLRRGLYYVGTHRNDRLGWPVNFAFTQKTRPKRMPRGMYRVAQAIDFPELIAVSWMDSKPVSMIATGCATTMTSVKRRAKGESVRADVPCPQVVADYHTGMGGVDQHDQLRLQRYSIQQCVAFKKYYRQLFLGFVDMAIVNGFILHKLILKEKGERVPTHAEYMRRLHTELLTTTETTLRANTNAEDLITEPIRTQPHARRYAAKYWLGPGRPPAEIPVTSQRLVM